MAGRAGTAVAAREAVAGRQWAPYGEGGDARKLVAEFVGLCEDVVVELRLDVFDEEAVDGLRDVEDEAALHVAHAGDLDEALGELLPIERLLAVEFLVGSGGPKRRPVLEGSNPELRGKRDQSPRVTTPRSDT